MGIVLAAIDNTATAAPVLAVAGAMADLLGFGVEAVHVREDGDLTARGLAGRASVAYREVPGPVVQRLIEEARREEVEALVIGTRGTPVGRHPAGHVAAEIMISVPKPLVVVPPELRMPVELRRIVVPLDGTAETAAALRGPIGLACCAALEVVVVHVYSAESLPLFEDQPQHERPAWEHEFLARYCPELAAGSRLEVRVGDPGEHVLDVARQVGADLLALGWSQDLSTGHAEVVREVLAHSHVPVILVPVEAERAALAAPVGVLAAT